MAAAQKSSALAESALSAKTGTGSTTTAAQSADISATSVEIEDEFLKDDLKDDPNVTAPELELSKLPGVNDFTNIFVFFFFFSF